MTNPYDDIIHLPRPVSRRHAPMSLIDRAAQFAPFAALTGYDAAIRETARLTDSAAELDECAREALDEKLRLLQSIIHTTPTVTIVYFQDDCRKAGGAYRTVTGKLRKIDTHCQAMILTDETVISFSQIYKINADLFEE
jgi:hypothetical protein